MNNRNYSVIVAEDETLLLDNLIGKINRLNIGFEVVGKAQTGIQAFNLIEELNPDLLITDIKMPVMDGLTLIEKVNNLYPFTKFVITSGFSDFEYAKKAIQFQVSEYLLKPVDEEELKIALTKIKHSFESERSVDCEIFNHDLAYSESEDIAEVLRAYLVQNYNTELNLSSIASNMNYSSSYLTKIFQERYETSPNKFIISMRICKAKEFLTHSPELTVSQIGEIVGYEDQGYFSRIFKKYCGLSPTAYRDEKDS